MDKSEYIKFRLLDYDSRFRNEEDFIFFWFDRLIKDRLFHLNRLRCINMPKLISGINNKNT